MKLTQILTDAAIGDDWKVLVSFDADSTGRSLATTTWKGKAPDKEAAKRYAVSDLTKSGKKNVKVTRATRLPETMESEKEEQYYLRVKYSDGWEYVKDNGKFKRYRNKATAEKAASQISQQTKLVPVNQPVSEGISDTEREYNRTEEKKAKLEADIDKAEDRGDDRAVTRLEAELKALVKRRAELRIALRKINEAANHMGEREYTTYGSWKAACKKAYPGCGFRGDKDIGAATIKADTKLGFKDVGEWDGAVGTVYNDITETLVSEVALTAEQAAEFIRRANNGETFGGMTGDHPALSRLYDSVCSDLSPKYHPDDDFEKIDDEMYKRLANDYNIRESVDPSKDAKKLRERLKKLKADLRDMGNKPGSHDEADAIDTIRDEIADVERALRRTEALTEGAKMRLGWYEIARARNGHGFAKAYVYRTTGADKEDELPVQVEFDYVLKSNDVTDADSPLVGPGADASAELTNIASIQYPITLNDVVYDPDELVEAIYKFLSLREAYNQANADTAGRSRAWEEGRKYAQTAKTPSPVDNPYDSKKQTQEYKDWDIGYEYGATIRDASRKPRH